MDECDILDPTTTPPPPPPPPLVLLHGYANGSMYFYRNLRGLSYYFGNVYALDMLGWGLSSRPRFDLIRASTVPSSSAIAEDDDDDDDDAIDDATRYRVRNAESFFVESIERWRVHHSLPKLTLAGHSMGGYLATAYAERYPHRVHRLILLSPVGVPRRPDIDEGTSLVDRMPFYARYPLRVARYLFERYGTTPGDFLRSLPHSHSRSMVESYVDRRLPSLATRNDERDALGEYLYQNSMLPGSGEYCLPELLTASAYARVPLVDRIPRIVVPTSSATTTTTTTTTNTTTNDDRDVDVVDARNGMEIHMIYGQRDWMDYRGGLDSQRACRERRVEWERRRRRRMEMGGGDGGHYGDVGPPPPRVYVHGVRDAGHLLMLDNHEEFNAAVILAAGGDMSALPTGTSRPVEFVYRMEEGEDDGGGGGGVMPISHGGGRGWRRGEGGDDEGDVDDGKSGTSPSGTTGYGGGREVLVGEDAAASFFIIARRRGGGRGDEKIVDDGGGVIVRYWTGMMRSYGG
ncbi:hypothetical protein ACHAXA_006180 [Cyclostephanos tholiformis]|uniref:AB hydrolase-1 domain-containing protein n=1 Tax=Cyclostephanos tholiformis TaxID=382380 RepID=A0ABD3RFL4_9STRA